MRKTALIAALGAGLAALAACQSGGDEAANEANDTLPANGVDASGGVNAGGVATGGTGAATDADGDGDLDVDVNLKVPEPKLEVSPDGVTVNAGDDPGVSVTTNGN